MRIVVVFIVVLFFVGTDYAYALHVEKCSNKTRQCIVVGSTGLVGDNISVLNEKGQMIATGWIIRKDDKSNRSVIAFRKILRSVKRGYPVIVDRKSFHLSWATSFSNH